MSQKRGQVTVYIIIGIIALVSVSIFLYVRSTKVEAPVSYRPTIEQIPVEAEPIRDFVQSCVYQVAVDGLKRVGDYGGYTTIEDMDASVDPFSPTEGSAVQFSPESPLVAPYWWYMSSPNDCLRCTFGSKRPDLLRGKGLSIEDELDRYVNNNLKQCLNEFADFASFGFTISEAGDVDTKTVVTQKTVAFHVRYPIVAEKEGVRYTINEYFVDIPVELKRIYDLATQITNLQIEYGFIENYINSLIAIFSSSKDGSFLPPKDETAIDVGNSVFWQKSKVKQNLASLMVAYLPLMRVYNTENEALILATNGSRLPIQKAVLFNQPFVPLTDNYTDFTATFTYLDWWNMYFDLNCDGEMCGPQSFSTTIPLLGDALGFKRYSFSYDISVPVLVDISYTSALNRSGYSFKFFIEANIRGNKKAAENITELPVISLGSGTLLCKESHRTYGPVSIKATDTVNGAPLEGVRMVFKCGNDACKLGDTAGNGVIEAMLPKCIGGNIVGTKKGYMQAAVPFDSNRVQENPRAEVKMYPYLYKDVEVRKYNIRKVFRVPAQFDMNGTLIANETVSETPSPLSIEEWIVDTDPQALSRKEEAVVVFKRNIGFGETAFTSTATYIGGGADTENMSKGIRIVPGYYDIEIYVTDYRDLEIPPREDCESGGLFGSDECFDIDGMTFNAEEPLMSGGVKLGRVYISPGDLVYNDKIVLYALTLNLHPLAPSSRKVEDLQKVADTIDSYSEMYRSMLMPNYEIVEQERDRTNQTTVIGGT